MQVNKDEFATFWIPVWDIQRQKKLNPWLNSHEQFAIKNLITIWSWNLPPSPILKIVPAPLCHTKRKSSKRLRNFIKWYRKWINGVLMTQRFPLLIFEVFTKSKLTNVSNFSTDGFPSKTNTGLIRKRSNLQSRWNRTTRCALGTSFPDFSAWWSHTLVSKSSEQTT